MMNNVAVQLDAPYNELSRAILNLSLSDTEKVISEHELFRQNQQRRLVGVKFKLAQLAKNETDIKLPSILAPKTQETRSVEMEKCKAPTFSGRTIDYPEFKRSWCKVAAVAWDDANQLQQMKQKVDSYTKKIISRCKDMNEVWDALCESDQEEESSEPDRRQDLRGFHACKSWERYRRLLSILGARPRWQVPHHLAR